MTATEGAERGVVGDGAGAALVVVALLVLVAVLARGRRPFR
jgi:hypothetical protein